MRATQSLNLFAVAVATLALQAGCGGKSSTAVVRPEPTASSERPNARPDDADRAGAVEIAATSGGAPSFGPIRFEFDSTNLSEADRQELQRLATWMQGNQAHVTIEGHTDDRGTSEYNIALGDRRAVTITEYLGRLGVDPARLKTISYGEERPANAEESETAWASNRRGELRPDSKE